MACFARPGAGLYHLQGWDFLLDPIWTDGMMLLKDTRGIWILKVYQVLESSQVCSHCVNHCEVASVVGTSIKRLWLQNAKQQDAAGDPISVLNALQGKKLRSLSTMAGKSSSQVVLDSPWDFVYFCWFHASNIWKVWISLNE